MLLQQKTIEKYLPKILSETVKKGFLALMKVERTLLLHLLKESHSPAFTSKESKCFQNVAQMKCCQDNTLLKPYDSKMEQEMK